MAEKELSDSGNPIYRYDIKNKKEYTPASGNNDSIELITKHIEENIGEIELVFHEIVSDLVHIDIYWIKPSKKFPFHTLVTSGMSDKPMNVPEGLEGFKYSELCILLPPEWNLGDRDTEIMKDAFKDENNYWPIRWLKTIARFPHKYNTWIGDSHTIPNGENAEPFAENTKLGCILILPPLSLGEPFFQLKIDKDKTIHFFTLVPIYKEEMNYKLIKGTDKLLDKFDKYQISDIVNISRENTCLKKGLLGLWK